ncbi:MAG: glycosyltransferase family 2 protein [Chitinivibrionales bacterium]
MMDLSIILVSYNTKDLTLKCLESLFCSLDKKIAFEAIVIDNNSTDGSPDALRDFEARMDNVRFIASESNNGFAKANNQGVRLAQGRFILLLNPDTYLIDDSCINAMHYLDDHPTVFGCGCTLLNADCSTGISYGKFPEFWTIFSEILTGRFGLLRCIVPKKINAIYSIDFPCGAFFMIKRELFNALGGFDERFFMYCEETDLAKRAWKSGFRIVHYGPAKAVHLRGQSSNQNTHQVSKNTVDLKSVLYQSWYFYLQKHCSKMEIFLIKFLLVVYYNAMLLFFSCKKNNVARTQNLVEKKALQENWKKNAFFIKDAQ